MTTQVAELLDMLAVRFGTTAEHLWGVLIQYHTIMGWLAVGCGLLLIGAGALVANVVRQEHLKVRSAIAKSIQEGFASVPAYLERAREARFAVVVMMCVLFIFGLVILGVVGTPRVLLPEYFALQEILGVVR